MKLMIFYSTDPFGPKVGGSSSFIKGLVKNAPSDIEIEFIGVTSDPHFPVKCWSHVKLGDKEFKFFPVLFEKNENKRHIIPLSFRFTFALLRCKLDYQGRVLFFNRIEPAVLFKNIDAPKMVVTHSDIEKQIKNKGSEVFWSRFPWLYFAFERYIFGFMTRVYAVSQSTIQFYKKAYPYWADKMSFLPTWVDDSIFKSAELSKAEIRKGLDLSDEDKQGKWVLFVGRLQEQKAPMRLIDTFKLYSQNEPDSRLIIVGDGNMKLDTEKYVNQLGLQRQVIFIKSIKQELLVKYYQASDTLLLTSNFEGMAICVLEALGCGLPVVSTDVGEARLVVKNGYSGEVVESFEPKDIAQALKKVLVNPRAYSQENCLDSVKLYTPLQVLTPVYIKIKEFNETIIKRP